MAKPLLRNSAKRRMDLITRTGIADDLCTLLVFVRFEPLVLERRIQTLDGLHSLGTRSQPVAATLSRWLQRWQLRERLPELTRSTCVVEPRPGFATPSEASSDNRILPSTGTSPEAAPNRITRMRGAVHSAAGVLRRALTGVWGAWRSPSDQPA